MATVVAFVGESRRERTVFEGTEDDARTYIQMKFPRLHIEPGSFYDALPAPDAVLDVNGARTFFDGSNWDNYTPPATDGSARTQQADDRDARIAELEAKLSSQQSSNIATQQDQTSAARIAELEAQIAASKTDPAPVTAPVTE